MTAPPSPDGTRTRARARKAPPPRCNHPRAEDGRPCRRAAGGGTDHAGVGPCARHDNGSWEKPPFAENAEAQSAFLAAVRAQRLGGIRELVEPLGYHKRDVNALIDSDPDFQDSYVEARGYDPDRIRSELADRGFDRNDPASAKLLELLAKMHLPEGQALQQRMRIDGQIEVRAIVASPQWLALRDRVLEALRPFPDALEAVLAALGQADEIEGEARELAA